MLAHSPSPVFRIQELNSPWRQVLHLSTKQLVGKHYHWIEESNEPTFSFLARGRVRLMSLSPSGHERIILDIGPGCIFREVILLHDSPAHPSTFEALQPCEVYNFPRALLDDIRFIQQYPSLMSNLVHSLGTKTGAFFSQISESGELEPRTKICRMLHRILDESQHNTLFSQSDLALLLGLHRSTVCRIIHELRGQGIIGRFTRLELEVLDLPSLIKLCHFS